MGETTPSTGPKEAKAAQKLSTRGVLFRPNQRQRRCAIKDVQTAFQSNQYDSGRKKFLKIRNPITDEWERDQQSDPTDGSRIKLTQRSIARTSLPRFESLATSYDPVLHTLVDIDAVVPDLQLTTVNILWQLRRRFQVLKLYTLNTIGTSPIA